MDLNSQSFVVNSDRYMKGGGKKAMSFSETLGAICWPSSRIAGHSLAKSKTSPNINSVCMCVRVCFLFVSYPGSRRKPGQNAERGRLPLVSVDAFV